MAWTAMFLLCLVHDGLGSGGASTPSSCAVPAPSHGPLFLQVSTRYTGWQVGNSHIARRRELGERILTASLVEGAGGRSAFDREIAAYTHMYRERINRSLLTFFQHVSKTAGTLLCSMGKANGCRSPDSLGMPDAINCNLRHDRLVWRPTPVHPDPEQRPATCEGLSEAYTGSNITLASTENYLIPAGLCPRFFNIMVLRDPVDRLISQLSMDYLFSRTRKTGREGWEAAPSPSIIFREMPASSNNFFIRSLLGREVYELPFGQVNASHLDKAKEVLESFDLLLVGEKGDPQALTSEISITLGWRVPERANSNPGHTDRYREHLNWGRAEWDDLRASNALDMALWEHARRLDSIDKAVFLHPSFSRVSTTLPHGACGFLSK